MIKCNIGDSFDSLLDFHLYNNPYSSDISKCYLRILVDDLTSRLRLLVWFEDPQKMTGVKIYRRPTMDFGDTCSSLMVRIVQEKFPSQTCKLELTKNLILNCAYADNYSGSFKDKKMYQQVKTDMIEVYNKIGLSLKCTYTAVQTDNKILDELGIGDNQKAVYNFLGLIWNMKSDVLTPNSYFALNKRKSGVKSGSLDECVVDSDSFFGEIKVTRRLLSRLCAQSYDRLAFLCPA